MATKLITSFCTVALVSTGLAACKTTNQGSDVKQVEPITDNDKAEELKPGIQGFEADGKGNVTIKMALRNEMGWPVRPLTILDDDGLATLAIVHYTLVSKPTVEAYSSNKAGAYYAALQNKPVETWAAVSRIYMHALNRAIQWYSDNDKAKDAQALKDAARAIEGAVAANRAPTYAEISTVGANLNKAITQHSYTMTVRDMLHGNPYTAPMSLGENSSSNPVGTLLISLSLSVSEPGPISRSGIEQLDADWTKLTQEYLAAFSAQ